MTIIISLLKYKYLVFSEIPLKHVKSPLHIY